VGGVVRSLTVDIWTFLWLMLLLKIPIVGLLSIVWWAIHQRPDGDSVAEDDGGIKHRPRPRHPYHPHPRLPHSPRRGPHGEPAPLPPVRMRTATARARRAPR
jgi:hypothetical protein